MCGRRTCLPTSQTRPTARSERDEAAAQSLCQGPLQGDLPGCPTSRPFRSTGRNLTARTGSSNRSPLRASGAGARGSRASLRRKRCSCTSARTPCHCTHPSSSRAHRPESSPRRPPRSSSRSAPDTAARRCATRIRRRPPRRRLRRQPARCTRESPSTTTSPRSHCCRCSSIRRTRRPRGTPQQALESRSPSRKSMAARIHRPESPGTAPVLGHLQICPGQGVEFASPPDPEQLALAPALLKAWGRQIKASRESSTRGRRTKALPFGHEWAAKGP